MTFDTVEINGTTGTETPEISGWSDIDFVLVLQRETRLVDVGEVVP